MKIDKAVYLALASVSRRFVRGHQAQSGFGSEFVWSWPELSQPSLDCLSRRLIHVVTIVLHLELIVTPRHNVTWLELSAAASFHFAIHQHFAGLNGDLRLAARADESREF